MSHCFLKCFINFQSRIVQFTCDLLVYLTQEAVNWLIMLAVMGYNGYIILSVLAGAGLGYAIFGESVAYARIHNVKLKAAMITCGECQCKFTLEIAMSFLT